MAEGTATEKEDGSPDIDGLSWEEIVKELAEQIVDPEPERDEFTVDQLQDEINAQGKNWSRRKVQHMLHDLMAKGQVTRRSYGRVYLYRRVKGKQAEDA